MTGASPPTFIYTQTFRSLARGALIGRLSVGVWANGGGLVGLVTSRGLGCVCVWGEGGGGGGGALLTLPPSLVLSSSSPPPLSASSFTATETPSVRPAPAPGLPIRPRADRDEVRTHQSHHSSRAPPRLLPHYFRNS